MASLAETSPFVEDFRVIADAGIRNRSIELESPERQVLEQIKLNKVSSIYNIKEALGIMYFFEGDKRRKDKTNYAASHQLEVMKILADAQITDEQVYIIAALHDTPENTAPTETPHEKYGSVQAVTLGEYFNSERIGKSIESLSLVKTMNDAKRNDETHLKLFRSLLEDPAVILVKLADRLHNMRTIGALTRNKQVEKATETMDIYVKLALKLGMNEWAYELAARSLAIVYRDSKSGSDVLLEVLANNYNDLFPIGLVDDLRNSIQSIRYSNLKIFANSLPRSIRDLVLDEKKPENMEPLKVLYDHYERNKKRIFPSTDTYYLNFDVVLPGENTEIEFLGNAQRVLLELHQVFLERYGWSLTKEQIYDALKNEKDGVVEVVIQIENNKRIILKIKTERALRNSEIGLDVLYKSATDDDKAIAEQRLSKLQKTLERIDRGRGGSEKEAVKKRYTNDIVHEFLQNLDADLISVFSPIEAEFIFNRGAKIIDYAYAAGYSIGNRAVSATIYRNGALVAKDVSLDQELKDGDKIELNLADHEAIDVQFIHRLDIATSEFTKESIAERIKEQMNTEELTLELIRKKEDRKMNFNPELTPTTIWVRERGFHFIENALQGRPGTLPDMPFFGAGYANPFGNDLSHDAREKFRKFVEEVGISRIEPDGRRKEYFERLINEILREQGNMLVIEMDVADKPNSLAYITRLFGREKVNIMYNSTRPDIHEIGVVEGRKKISKVRIITNSSSGAIFKNVIRPQIEARGWKVTLPPTRVKNYKSTPSWVTLFSRAN